MRLSFPAEGAAAKALSEFNEGKMPNNKMIFLNGKDGAKPLRLWVQFECMGDISPGQFNNHTIYAKFIYPQDLEDFVALEHKAEEFTPKDIEFKSMLRDTDKMYLKLAIKGLYYNVNFDPLILPDSLDKSPIHQGTTIDVEFQPNIWMNLEERKAGIYLKIFKIVVQDGKKIKR